MTVARPLLVAGVVAGTVAIIGAGVAANFSALRTPNDGVYYVTAARALLETGQHVDATVIPYGPPITRQNGVVYVLAALIAVAGSAWPIAWAMLVAALWIAAIVVMARFYGELLDRAGWPFAILTVLQYDLLNDSTSFMNEGLYAPAFFLLAAQFGRHLLASAPMPRWFGPALLVFLLAGLFFRNQHVVALGVAAAALGLAGRWMMAVTVPVAALGAFAVYAATLPAPVTDGYFATVTRFESIEASDAPYALALFTGPLSLTKLVPYGHPVVIVTGLAAAAAVAAGLLRLRRAQPALAGAIALYIAGTLVFLVMLPFVSTRYFALANLPLLAAMAVLVPRQVDAARLVGAAALVIAGVAGLYVQRYLSGEKREQAYPQLVAHQRAALVAGDSLIYSSQPRMVAWVLGIPACAVAPDACAAARGLENGRSVVFIGQGDELEGQEGLHGYAIARPLTDPAAGYAAWLLTRVTP